MPHYQPKLPPLDPCPVEHVVALIGGRWKARILHRLSLGDAAANELVRHLKRARPQVVAAQLGAMERNGLVERLPLLPGRMWGVYRITSRGRSLHAALSGVADWGTVDIGGWVAPSLQAA
jgi:DNA-binding HxlR family transcriptional regulator